MADGARTDGKSPETVDRLMVGVCGAIWLVFLVVAAIATVALVNMGRGHRAVEGPGDSSWLLYTIIAVSAAVIVGAIPLLLRARRSALETRAGEASAEPTEAPVRPGPAPDAPTEKIRVFGTVVDPAVPRVSGGAAVAAVNTAAVDRVSLRGGLSLLGAMGLALIGVATASYLLAESADTGAWVALGVAGVITLAMPAILVVFQRQLGAVSAPA